MSKKLPKHITELASNWLYLIRVMDDVTPILLGPYKTEAARLRAARRLRKNDPEMHDGIFQLDCPVLPGIRRRPVVSTYSGGQLDGCD